MIDVESGGSSIEISDSYYYNNLGNAVQITIYNRTECPRVSIIFINVTFYKTGTFLDTGDILYIDTENTVLSAMFKMSNLCQTII